MRIDIVDTGCGIEENQINKYLYLMSHQSDQAKILAWVIHRNANN